jgi:hypothetical protein
MERIREQLGASEEEWRVLQPKVEKVMTAQRESAAGRGFGGGRGGRGGGGGGGGGGAAVAETPVARAMSELRTTLDNTGATAEQINQRLTALRDARKTAQANLDTARKELKEVLTQRQEAVLVVNGMLE